MYIHQFPWCYHACCCDSMNPWQRRWLRLRVASRVRVFAIADPAGRAGGNGWGLVARWGQVHTAIQESLQCWAAAAGPGLAPRQ